MSRRGHNASRPVAFVTPSAPTVTSASPNSGTLAGGTAITITGTLFRDGCTVTVGGVSPTSVVRVNSTTITCVTPAHAGGAVSIVVTNPDAQTGTGAAAFTYSTPTVTSLSNGVCDIAGGDVTLVNGTGFVTGCTIVFGVTAGTVTFVSATQLSVVTPAKAAGTYNVVVTNPDTGTSGSTGNGLYEAWSPAQITGIDSYFDSRKGVTLGTGTKVTTWTEQTRTDDYASVSTFEPNKITNVFASTVPAIRFVNAGGSNTNQWVRHTRRAGFSGGISVFWVGKSTSTDSTETDNPNNLPLTVVGDSTTSVVENWGMSAGKIAGIVTQGLALGTTSTFNDGVVRLLGSTHSTGNTFITYTGETVDRSQGFTYNTLAGFDTIGAGRGNGGGATGGDGYDGDLGAVVIVVGVISGGDLTKLHKWSQAGFGAA